MVKLLVFYLCFVTYTRCSNYGFINPGTPSGITSTFDCAVREYAYEYAKSLQPWHGTFVHIFDALQLEACNQTRPKPTDRNIPFFKSQINANCTFYIDPINGSDTNSGITPLLAFQTIEKGIEQTRKTRVGNQKCTLNCLNGTFYQRKTIFLQETDSFLTIQNYNGANVIISGGIPIQFQDEWQLYKYQETKWQNYSGYDNVESRVSFNRSNDIILFLGIFTSYDACFEAIISHNNKPNGPIIYSFTWYSFANMNLPFGGGCYGVQDISWQITARKLGKTITGRLHGLNIWKRKVANYNEFENKIPGLRVNGRRAIRCRYPKHDPEISMQFDALSGWMPQGGSPLQIWMDPINSQPAQVIIKNATNYPGVDWPMFGAGNSTWTGQGDWGNFFQSIGGPCVTELLGGIDPPFGYWCSNIAPRKIMQHKCPSGCYLLPDLFPNAPYSNVTGIVIHAWKPSHWYTWAFEGGMYDTITGGVTFIKGGFQGGEGESIAVEWYIENVFEELNGVNEYFYDRDTHYLYYYHNNTSKSPPSENMEFIATYNNVLVNISGCQQNPVRNVSIGGITFKDTRYTYMDGHGLPSGGDWALARQGSIFIQGTEYVHITHILMTRLDATGIFINGYNRYTVIENSEFEWLGENAIAAWGYTSGLEDILPGYGPDGRNGDQPRYTTIKNNLVREIGIFQKQSAFWFQAQTCQTRIENNICFNVPRAAVNINDGFGGDNHMIGNLLLNTCRESGDHGAWNSWDRIPYITRVKNGTASIIPAFNQIHHNFIIATYQASLAIDTDDGSSYINTTNNFFVYGGAGLKSDYSGHHHFHSNNIYAYTERWFYIFKEAGAYDRFYNNKFISLINNQNQCGYSSNCDLPPYAVGMETHVYNNSIYTLSGKCQICGMSFQKWISRGNDIGSTLDYAPSDKQIIEWAKELLDF